MNVATAPVAAGTSHTVVITIRLPRVVRIARLLLVALIASSATAVLCLAFTIAIYWAADASGVDGWLPSPAAQPDVAPPGLGL